MRVCVFVYHGLILLHAPPVHVCVTEREKARWLAKLDGAPEEAGSTPTANLHTGPFHVLRNRHNK